MPGISREDMRRIVRRIGEWRKDPPKFAAESLGVRSLYAHQLIYLDHLGGIVNAKRLDRFFKADLTATERMYAGKIGISIMSGRGSGKDCVAAIGHTWFTSMFEPHLVVATGPNRDHLRRVYWGEVEKWVKRRRDDGSFYFPWADDYHFTATSIVRKNPDKVRCLSIYRTVQKDADDVTQAEGVSGMHEKYVFYLLDEASAIPYPVYSTLKASMTRRDDVRVMTVLFNPNRNSGFAHDIHFAAEGELFIPLHWDLTELDCADPKALEDARRMYGEDSNYFRVNYRGLPPLNDSSKVIPWEFIADAVEREVEYDKYEKRFLIDPAGEGKDKTRLIVKQGPRVLEYHTINEAYSDKIADWVIDRYHMHEPGRIYIDKNGVGLGVFSILRTNFGRKVVGVNVTEDSRRKDKFVRLRSELWWKTREMFEEGRISLPDTDRRIQAELAAPGYTTDGGKILVDNTRAIKKLLKGDSPDWASALILDAYHDFDRYDKSKLNPDAVSEVLPDAPRPYSRHRPGNFDRLAWLRG